METVVTFDQKTILIEKRFLENLEINETTTVVEATYVINTITAGPV